MAERLADRLRAGPLDQPCELHQLEKPGDRAVDVNVGVEPRLRELAAGAPGLLQDLVLNHPVGRLQALGRSEELLGVALLGRVEHRSRLLVEGGGSGCSLLGGQRPREHQILARAGHRHVEKPPAFRLERGRRARELRGHRGRSRRLGPGHRPGLHPDDVEAGELEPLQRFQRHHPDRVGHRRARLVRRGDPGLRDGDQVADEVAVRAAGLAPGPIRRQLAEAGEAAKPLGGLGMGGEEAVAPEADPLDQPPDEDVGAHLAHRLRRGSPEAEEGADPVACLGRDLGTLQRGLERRDHVELAAPGDRRAAGEIDRAKLDRGPAQRPHRGGGVSGVSEQAQPGDHVPHLGTSEEGVRPGDPVGDAPLLEGGGDRALATAPARHRDAEVRHLQLALGERRLDLAGDSLSLGPLVVAAPEADPGRWPGGAAGSLGAAAGGRHHGVGGVEEVAAVTPGRLQHNLLAAAQGLRTHPAPPPQRAPAPARRRRRAPRCGHRAPAARSGSAPPGRRPRARRRSGGESAPRRRRRAPDAPRAAG